MKKSNHVYRKYIRLSICNSSDFLYAHIPNKRKSECEGKILARRRKILADDEGCMSGKVWKEHFQVMEVDRKAAYSGLHPINLCDGN